jgi:hypothetical protein
MLSQLNWITFFSNASIATRMQRDAILFRQW